MLLSAFTKMISTRIKSASRWELQQLTVIGRVTFELDQLDGQDSAFGSTFICERMVAEGGDSRDEYRRTKVQCDYDRCISMYLSGLNFSRRKSLA